MQGQRDVYFRSNFPSSGVVRSAALPAGDLHRERADLGPDGGDFGRGAARCPQRAGRVDRRMGQVARGIRLEAVVENVPPAERDRPASTVP